MRCSNAAFFFFLWGGSAVCPQHCGQGMRPPGMGGLQCWALGAAGGDLQLFPAPLDGQLKCCTAGRERCLREAAMVGINHSPSAAREAPCAAGGGCDFHRLSPPQGGLGAFGAPAWGRARQGRGVGQRQGPAEPWGGHPRGLGVALRDPRCWRILHQLPRVGFLADGRGMFLMNLPQTPLRSHDALGAWHSWGTSEHPSAGWGWPFALPALAGVG